MDTNQVIIDRLERLLAEEKIFLSEGFSIDMLCNSLGFHKSRVNECLVGNFGKTIDEVVSIYISIYRRELYS